MTLQEIENHVLNIEENLSNFGMKQSELCGKNDEDIRNAERKLIEANSTINEMQGQTLDMAYQICLLQLGVDDIDINPEE